MAGLGIAVLCACSSNPPGTFSVDGASVDATHWCPGGSNDTSYDVHATIEVRNGTSSAVTIKSVAASMTLESVTGSWLEKVGDMYEAPTVTFDPASIAAGGSGRINVTFPSSCTSGPYNAARSSQGDYLVRIRLTTSAGAYSIAASNRHSILAA
jgi:hypothetical protein